VSAATLRDSAAAVLAGNDVGAFVKPGRHQYPHQWNWDAAFVAMGLAHVDPARARREVRTLLSGQWQGGMVPHIVYPTGASDYFPTPEFWQTSAQQPDVATSGLTQPPVLATAVRYLCEHDPDGAASLAFLREVYPRLLASHRWLYRTRDPDRTGLVAIVHPWESGTDDATRWTHPLESVPPSGGPTYRRRDTRHVAAEERPSEADYARFMHLIGLYRDWGWDAETLYRRAPFLVQDVMFNAVLLRANDDLRALAEQLGEPTTEIDDWQRMARAAFDARAWSEARGRYLDVDLRRGAPIDESTCATFTPLFAGVPDAARAERLVAHLRDPDAYAPDRRTRYYLPSASKSSPLFEPRRYWRGPVWINVNWLVAEGLRTYGHHDLADTIDRHSLELVERSGFREYYDPRDGRGCGATEFSWSAALTLVMLRGRA
jgi:glycogen debranching enzyme